MKILLGWVCKHFCLTVCFVCFCHSFCLVDVFLCHLCVCLVSVFLPGLGICVRFMCFWLVCLLLLPGFVFVSVWFVCPVCMFVFCLCFVCVCFVFRFCFYVSVMLVFLSSFCFCLVWVFVWSVCGLHWFHLLCVWFICFCLVCVLLSGLAFVSDLCMFLPDLCMFLFGFCVSAWFVCCWRGSPGWRRSVNCYQWFSQTGFCACLCKLCLMTTSGKTDIRLPPAFKGDQTATSI